MPLYDLVADFRRYYHVSPSDLTSIEVIELSERLHRYWSVNVDVEPKRVESSVFYSQQARCEAEAESRVLSGADLTQLGIEFTEV